MTSASVPASGHVSRIAVPIRYRDLDTLGHLNQSVYHVMLEEARVAFILEVLHKRIGEFVLGRVELDYRHEVRLDDREVVIDTWLQRVGTSSIRLASRLSTPDGGVAAEGLTVLVGWDPARRGARPLSDEEQAALRAAQPERGPAGGPEGGSDGRG